jgi:hypothetical protein
VRLTGATSPQPETVARYEESYALYRELYPALKTIAWALSEQ